MKRGDIVTVALQGDYGKPRPAVVIESDMIPPGDSVILCPISSTLHIAGPFRRQQVQIIGDEALEEAAHVVAREAQQGAVDEGGRGHGPLIGTSIPKPKPGAA